MSALVYPHFIPFTCVLPQVIHFYPGLACFTPFLPMFTPSYPRFFSFFVYASLFDIHVFICLPCMLTPVYPRSYSFTHVCSFLSTFRPVYRGLRQLYTFNPVYPCLPQFIHVVPRLSMFTPIYPRFIPFTYVEPKSSFQCKYIKA